MKLINNDKQWNVEPRGKQLGLMLLLMLRYKLELV
jgi:hypothetical protein